MTGIRDALARDASGRLVMVHRCQRCGEPFVTRRGGTRYCTGRCRQAAHRARHASTRAARAALVALTRALVTLTEHAARHGLPDEATHALDDAAALLDQLRTPNRHTADP